MCCKITLMPTTQFEDYDDGLKHAQDDENAVTDPFLYEGERLNACNFPLGSFGTSPHSPWRA